MVIIYYTKEALKIWKEKKAKVKLKIKNKKCHTKRCINKSKSTNLKFSNSFRVREKLIYVKTKYYFISIRLVKFEESDEFYSQQGNGQSVSFYIAGKYEMCSVTASLVSNLAINKYYVNPMT